MCGKWDANFPIFFSNDSVDCAVCKNTYHMNCVRPPLLKKPSRGFAWSCAACARAQERKLEARNTPTVHDNIDEDEEFFDDDEEAAAAKSKGKAAAAKAAAGTGTGSGSSPEDGGAIDDTAGLETAEQMYQASLWQFRYLGIHCKAEDALDYDDRIYPRAGSRLGPRHQAIVQPWPGKAIEYVKRREFAKTGKGGKRDKGQNKEMQAALEADKKERANRPKWVQDEPAGYVARGEDLDNDDPNCTATVLYKPPEEVGLEVTDAEQDEYLETARQMATTVGLPERSTTNLQDVAIGLLFQTAFDAGLALKRLKQVSKAAFKEPELSAAEQKKFEEGVAKFGSETYLITRFTRIDYWDVVRYYYKWKKTERGKQVWGNFPGRKGKKAARKAEEEASRLADEVADDHDDSAFDTYKSSEKRRAFICKFCGTRQSRQWRRAPGSSALSESNSKMVTATGNGGGKDKSGNGAQAQHYVSALCRRCAEPWRRYGIQWEDVAEIAKKASQAGGRTWRRKVDEELMKELNTATEMARVTDQVALDAAAAAATNGHHSAGGEPARKRLKITAPDSAPDSGSEATTTNAATTTTTVVSKKKAAADKAAAEKAAAAAAAAAAALAPPQQPEFPKPRTLPCAICRRVEPLGDQHLSCKECRLAVHRNCYGVVDNRQRWTCDMCANDKNPQVAIVSVGWFEPVFGKR